MQFEIDFVHDSENNSESQKHLNDKRKKFNKQCLFVIDLLNSGVELTTEKAIVNYKIFSLARRILDIKQKLNIKIPDRWENGVKVWYVKEEIKY